MHPRAYVSEDAHMLRAVLVAGWRTMLSSTANSWWPAQPTAKPCGRSTTPRGVAMWRSRSTWRHGERRRARPTAAASGHFTPPRGRATWRSRSTWQRRGRRVEAFILAAVLCTQWCAPGLCALFLLPFLYLPSVSLHSRTSFFCLFPRALSSLRSAFPAVFPQKAY